MRAARRNNHYAGVTGSEEEGGEKKVTLGVSTGGKPKHFEEQKVISPDAKRRLRVVRSGEDEQAWTFVTVEFPTANGAVYVLNGICPEVKASWKDNSTIVIETKTHIPHTHNTGKCEVLRILSALNT